MNPVTLPAENGPEMARMPKIKMGDLIPFVVSGGVHVIIFSFLGGFFLLALAQRFGYQPLSFWGMISAGFLLFACVSLPFMWRGARVKSKEIAVRRLVPEVLYPYAPEADMQGFADEMKIRYFDLCVAADALDNERLDLLDWAGSQNIPLFSVGLKVVNAILAKVDLIMDESGYCQRVQQHNAAVAWMNDALMPPLKVDA